MRACASVYFDPHYQSLVNVKHNTVTRHCMHSINYKLRLSSIVQDTFTQMFDLHVNDNNDHSHKDR